MMTALIKMGQIVKGWLTMEIQKGLPAGLCALPHSFTKTDREKREGMVREAISFRRVEKG